MSRSNDWNENDRSAKKARKSADAKHKSSRRHDEKKHLNDYVNDLNSKRKDDIYDEYEDYETNN